jgi:hypothetical protein
MLTGRGCGDASADDGWAAGAESGGACFFPTTGAADFVSGAGWAIVSLAATDATRSSAPKAPAVMDVLIVEIPGPMASVKHVPG